MHVREHCDVPRRGKIGSMWMCDCGKVYRRGYVQDWKVWKYVGRLVKEDDNYPAPPEPTAQPSKVRKP